MQGILKNKGIMTELSPSFHIYTKMMKQKIVKSGIPNNDLLQCTLLIWQ